MRYPHLAARIYNTPLAIQWHKATVIEAVLRGEGAEPTAVVATQQEAFAARRPYRVTENGIAVIPVLGTLVHRSLGIEALSGLTSYQRLGRLLHEATSDAQVRGIMLDVDSPGGESSGLFDFAARIARARDAKPVWAVANEDAYSAAYAIAAAGGRLYAPPTGRVGSIGVIALHVDQSEHDAKQGIAYTAVFAGASKNDFSAHAPLSNRAQATLQAMVDEVYEAFVAAVASHRKLEAAAVRATEAAIFPALAALERGLIDGIASLDEVIALMEMETNVSRGGDRLEAKTGGSQTRQQIMASEGAEPPQARSNNMTEQHSRIPSTADDVAAARAEGYAAGEAAERERVCAILGASEAAERPRLAQQMVAAGLSVEQALALLRSAPKETPEAGAPFARAMAALGNPDVAPDAGGEADTVRAEINRIVQLFQGG